MTDQTRTDVLRKWLDTAPELGPPHPAILQILRGLSYIFECWAQGCSADARVEGWNMLELLKTPEYSFEGSDETAEVMEYAAQLPRFDHQQMLFRLSERLWKQVLEGSEIPG